MYEKNLTELIRLRVSEVDMDFLKKISAERGISVSGCIRYIVGDYRRTMELLDTVTKHAEQK